MTLVTTPNLPDPDMFYAALLAAHKGLTEDESHALNARLVLILANHAGDMDVLREALDLARR
jgi:hypothetical protein